MSKENNYGNPYGQYGNGEAPNTTGAELNHQALGQPTDDYGQQASGGQAYPSSYTGTQTGGGDANFQGSPGYGTSQSYSGNTSTQDYPQYNNSQAGSPSYAAPGYGYSQPAINYSPYGTVEAQKPKGMAITALVLGIVGFIFSWFVFGGIFALVGLVLGIIALMKTKTGGGGKGFAIAGIVLGSIGLVISILIMIFFGWIFATVGKCSHYQDDNVLYDQCISKELGIESSYSTYNYHNS